VEAEQLLAVTRSALLADGDLLSADERQGLEVALATLDEARLRADAAALRAQIEEANRASMNFAQRRMDRGVTRALAGKRVDSLV
jgi:molecular chaperone HscA